MTGADLRIENARIVDGSGEPGVMGTITIADGLIAPPGDDRRATRTIDADGLVLAPGFIDLHTHTDFTLPVFPDAAAMVRQGVTTQVVGNCGFSPFPNPPDRRKELIDYTSFIDAGIPWDRWEDAAGYAEFLDTLPLGSNIALQIGLSTLRMAVMGFERRAPRPQELEEMERILEAAFDAGVVGVSSGLVYPPGGFAEADEVVDLVGVAARRGGIYSTHIRNEAGSLVEAVDEALGAARRTGVPLQLSHHKALGRSNWGKVEVTLSRIDEARAAGYDVLADQYPYRAGSTGFTQILPGWALEGGVDAMRAVLSDPTTRARIVDALERPGPEATREFEPESILLSQIPEGPNKRYEGMYLSEIAAERREDPKDCAFRLLLDEGAGILMVIFAMSEQDVRRVMTHPAVAIASDGWTLSPAAGGRPHPRSYGTYARVLGSYVREEGMLPLEEAVRKMTSLPARRLPGLQRGRIAPGFAADLVLFDPATIRDEATFEDPHRFCTGVHHVVVGGELAVEDGELTGAAPGRVLRRAGG